MAEEPTSLATTETADEFGEECGYELELKRSLGGFQVFAISFASMSSVGLTCPR